MVIVIYLPNCISAACLTLSNRSSSLRNLRAADEFIWRTRSSFWTVASACGTTMSASANAMPLKNRQTGSLLCVTNRWKWKKTTTPSPGATPAGWAYKTRFLLSIHHFHRGPLVSGFDAQCCLGAVIRHRGLSADSLWPQVVKLRRPRKRNMMLSKLPLINVWRFMVGHSEFLLKANDMLMSQGGFVLLLTTVGTVTC